ncbi:hypothetical protein ACFQVC_16220 [Streptomyces monticola]|uniref:Uncharacterized protein n=1 Tax=Streptomyces monticola TaxID=2666263 RepID=A0ABW2JI93_9ACTN
MATMGRGPRRLLWGMWGICLVVAVAFVGYVVWLVILYVANGGDDPFLTGSDISCGQAMAYANGSLPDQVTDQDCEFHNWMDDQASGTFRMPRADARSWLSSTYPDGDLDTASCGEGTDLCLRQDFEHGTAGSSVHGVRIDVTYEDGDTALVRLSAFST